MNKGELKPGMVIEVRKGDRYIVLENIVSNLNTYFPLCYYDENLKHENKLSEWDIVRVFESGTCGVKDMLDKNKLLVELWKRV